MDSHGGVQLRLGRRPGGEEAGQEGCRSPGGGHELGRPARPSWRWQGSGKRYWSVWWCWCGGHGIWRLGVKRGRCQSSAGTSARNAVALPCKEEETGIKSPGGGTKAVLSHPAGRAVLRDCERQPAQRGCPHRDCYKYIPRNTSMSTSESPGPGFN